MKKQLLLSVLLACVCFLSQAQPFKKPQQFKLGHSLNNLEKLKASSKENPISANEFTWDADDQAWIPMYNYSYTYDQNVLVENVAYNSLGVPESRTRYVYDGKNLVEQLTEFWVMGTWTNSYRLVLEYDANDELRKEELQDWINNEWQITYGIARSVNIVHADTTVIIDSMWGGSIYEAVQKTENIYVSGTKDLASMVLYMPNGSGDAWFESYREVYVYDSNAKLAELIKQNWDGMSWQNFMKHTNYRFDSLGLELQSYKTQNWDRVGNLWSDYSYDTLEYLANKSFINTSYYLLNQVKVPSIRSIFLNDSLMNQILVRYDTWEQSINDWVASIHNENVYTYAADSLIKIKVDLALNQFNQLDSMSKMEYFYNNTTGLSNERELEFNIAPNPCADVLQVMIPDTENTNELSFEIRNISGQLLKTINASGNEHKLDLSDLSTGMYILRLNTASASKSTKFIIK